MDPRSSYLAGGALFLLVALASLIGGSELVAALMAMIAAGLFWAATRATSVG